LSDVLPALPHPNTHPPATLVPIGFRSGHLTAKQNVQAGLGRRWRVAGAQGASDPTSLPCALPRVYDVCAAPMSRACHPNPAASVMRFFALGVQNAALGARCHSLALELSRPLPRSRSLWVWVWMLVWAYVRGGTSQQGEGEGREVIDTMPAFLFLWPCCPACADGGQLLVVLHDARR